MRVVSPSDVTKRLVAELETHPGVLGLVVLEGVARKPAGDSVAFDVVTAEANTVLERMRGLDLDRRGSIAIESGDSYLSSRADRVRRTEPLAANVSPVWEEAEARIRSLGVYPPSWHLLLIIAGLIAAVGIFTNSQILVVAAMVVGPEYGAIINVSLGWREHYAAMVQQSRALRPDIVVTAHGPVLRGEQVDDAFDRTIALAAQPVPETPGQAMLDQPLASRNTIAA